MIDFLINFSQLWDKLELKNAPGQNLFVSVGVVFFCNPTNPTQYWPAAHLEDLPPWVSPARGGGGPAPLGIPLPEGVEDQHNIGLLSTLSTVNLVNLNLNLVNATI